MRNVFACVIAAAALAACAKTVTVPPPCVEPAIIPLFALIYPSPGATNVPDNTSELLFAGAPYQGSATNVVVSTNAQTVATITSFPTAAPPLPSPLPSSPPGPYLAAPLPSLAPATTYTVTYNYSIATCGPVNRQSETLGSFTTQ